MDINLNIVVPDRFIEVLETLSRALTTSQHVAISTPTTKAPNESQKEKPQRKTASESAITLETVRAKLATLSQDGKQKEVKALITSFGAAKLTEIPVEKYSEVLEKAEALS